MKLGFYLDTRQTNKDGKSVLKIVINNKNTKAFISTGLTLKKDQWKNGRVTGCANSLLMNRIITRKLNDIEELTLNYRDTFESKTASQIKTFIERRLKTGGEPDNDNSFLAVLRRFIETRGAIRTKEVYKATEGKITAFCEERKTSIESLTFEDINFEFLVAFDRWLAKTMSLNSRDIHFRNLRAVFNYALDEEITTFYPFRKFKHKTEETVKRALTLEELRDVFYSPCKDWEQRWVDCFKLAFCLIGINLVDLFSLTPDSINHGRIEYHRAKTNKLYSIKIEPEAAALIEKYKGSDHLLCWADEYNTYAYFKSRMNKVLKGLFGGKYPHLCYYACRHSWATMAAELDIPNETIAAALGHTYGSRVTNIYIRFNEQKVDKANRMVLDFIKK